jgi:hypothetical protein
MYFKKGNPKGSLFLLALGNMLDEKTEKGKIPASRSFEKCQEKSKKYNILVKSRKSKVKRKLIPLKTQ